MVLVCDADRRPCQLRAQLSDRSLPAMGDDHRDRRARWQGGFGGRHGDAALQPGQPVALRRPTPVRSGISLRDIRDPDETSARPGKVGLVEPDRVCARRRRDLPSHRLRFPARRCRAQSIRVGPFGRSGRGAGRKSRGRALRARPKSPPGRLGGAFPPPISLPILADAARIDCVRRIMRDKNAQPILRRRRAGRSLRRMPARPFIIR